MSQRRVKCQSLLEYIFFLIVVFGGFIVATHPSGVLFTTVEGKLDDMNDGIQNQFSQDFEGETIEHEPPEAQSEN